MSVAALATEELGSGNWVEELQTAGSKLGKQPENFIEKVLFIGRYPHYDRSMELYIKRIQFVMYFLQVSIQHGRKWRLKVDVNNIFGYLIEIYLLNYSKGSRLSTFSKHYLQKRRLSKLMNLIQNNGDSPVVQLIIKTTKLLFQFADLNFKMQNIDMINSFNVTNITNYLTDNGNGAALFSVIHYNFFKKYFLPYNL